MQARAPSTASYQRMLCGREAENGVGGGEGVVADGGSGWHGDAGEGRAAAEGAVADGGEAGGRWTVGCEDGRICARRGEHSDALHAP